jgi:DNA-binding transcriptional MocR family regulator
MSLDTEIRLHIYRRFAEEGRPPSVDQAAEALDASPADVEAAYRRLAEGRVIVLEPGTADIWMANPFSAVPTSFRVQASDRWWWGTCAWDAPGILAMLDVDGTITSSCADCGEAIELRVESGRLQSAEAVGHFAVPAARWWEDIGYT